MLRRLATRLRLRAGYDNDAESYLRCVVNEHDDEHGERTVTIIEYLKTL